MISPSRNILSDFSCNLHSITSLLPPFLSFLPYSPLRGLVDLIINILTFSPSGFSSCGQGHITGKWSVEQNGWQGLRWTGQWVVECWGRGSGWKDSWMSDMRAAVRKKEGEKHRRVKPPWHTVHCPDDPSHFLSAEGYACQRLSPSCWLQQLSNICSLDLTDERDACEDGMRRMSADPT